MILYNGPSLLDGKPIMVIVSDRSTNVKTGDMLQTWIIRSDIRPHEAKQTGEDFSVCGDCPQRARGCYVPVFHAPTTMFDTAPKTLRSRHRIRRILRSRTPVRIGSYGDPAAVPYEIWEAFSVGRTSTGYTHQWRTCDQRLQALCMASVDTGEEECEAQAMGWRTFRVIRPGEAPGPRSVQCLNTARDLQCADCGICDGSKGPDDARASVWVPVHGNGAKYYTARDPSKIYLSVIK